MKSYRKELWFNLPTRRGFVNNTPQVEAALRESGIQEQVQAPCPLICQGRFHKRKRFLKRRGCDAALRNVTASVG